LIDIQLSPSEGSFPVQIKECSIHVATVVTQSNERASLTSQLTLERRSLSIDSDYSYTLQVDDKDGSCSITSNTVWGAMYAMETLTHQLIRETPSGDDTKKRRRRSLRDGGDHSEHDHHHDKDDQRDNKHNHHQDEDENDKDSTDSYYIYCNNTALFVSDSSRFSHRGLLIDSARHYLSLSQVRSVIDTLPMNKLNILHWHISDAESCPLALASIPDMVKGAWNPSAIYNDKDIKHINDYAADRGVFILFEVDVPGHTGK